MFMCVFAHTRSTKYGNTYYTKYVKIILTSCFISFLLFMKQDY